MIRKGTTLLSFKLSIGKVAIAGVDLYTNEAIAGLEPIRGDVVLDKYLYCLFVSCFINLEKGSFNAFGKSLNSTFLKEEVKIPLPPLDVQQQIVDEMEILGQRERENKENVERLKNSIGLLLPKNIASIKVDDIALMLKRGKSPKYGDSHIQIIKSWQARGVRTFDFAERHFVDASFVLDERKIEKWDILINSTGVGTAGRVTLFDLDGDFVVDTHITILRLDRSRAIPIYILSYFVDFGFKNIEALALGQSGQIELSIETIKNFKIPLPPLSEQQRIVIEIEQIEGKIAELEVELASIPAQKEAILKKYL